MDLRLAWASDPGLERDQNEDSVYVAEDIGKLDALLLVADGMGGHQSGQVASRLVVKTVAEELEGNGELSPEHLRKILAKANTAG